MPRSTVRTASAASGLNAANAAVSGFAHAVAMSSPRRAATVADSNAMTSEPDRARAKNPPSAWATTASTSATCRGDADAIRPGDTVCFDDLRDRVECRSVTEVGKQNQRRRDAQGGGVVDGLGVDVEVEPDGFVDGAGSSEFLGIDVEVDDESAERRFPRMVAQHRCGHDRRSARHLVGIALDALGTAGTLVEEAGDEGPRFRSVGHAQGQGNGHGSHASAEEFSSCTCDTGSRHLT